MGLKITIVVVVLLAVAAAGLAFYGSTVEPQQKAYEQVLPDDRFEK